MCSHRVYNRVCLSCMGLYIQVRHRGKMGYPHPPLWDHILPRPCLTDFESSLAFSPPVSIYCILLVYCLFPFFLYVSYQYTVIFPIHSPQVPLQTIYFVLLFILLYIFLPSFLNKTKIIGNSALFPIYFTFTI